MGDKVQTRLAESENFVLTHDYECAELHHKASSTVIDVGHHYGDPTCGLIAPDESWCVTGGEGIVLHYRAGKTWFGFRRAPQDLCEFSLQPTNQLDLDWMASKSAEGFLCVHDIRLDGPMSVRILLDPWSTYASTWQLDVEMRRLTRLRHGPDRCGQTWTSERFRF